MAKGNEKSGGSGNSGRSSNSGGAKSGAANVQLPNIPRLNYSTTDKSSARGRGREAYTRQNIADRKSAAAAAAGQDPAASSASSQSSQAKSQEQKQQSQDRNFLAETAEQGIKSRNPEGGFLDEAMNGRESAEKKAQDKARSEYALKQKQDARQKAADATAEADRLEAEKRGRYGDNPVATTEEEATAIADTDKKIADLRAKADEELSKVNTTNSKRDAAVDEYLKAVEAERTIADGATILNQAELDAVSADRKQKEEALKELNRALGNDEYFGLVDEAQSRDLFEGWAGERAAGSAAALGTGMEWLGDKTNADFLTDAGSTLFNAAQGWQGQAQEDWASGTSNMSETEKQVAGLAKTGADMTMDMIENMILPGAGRVAMAARVAGGGALTQAGRERNDVDARMTKAVLDGGVAFLSEYLLGGAEQVYGKSVVGKGLKKMFGKASPVLKTVLNTEGLEEGLEYALGYLGDKLLKLDPNGEFSADELKQNMLVGYIMGVLFNGIAGGIEYGGQKLQAVVDEAYDAVESGVTPQEATQIAMLQPNEEVKIDPSKQVSEPEAETGPEIQRVEQAPEGEPSSTVTVPLTETAPMETSPNPMIAAIQERMTISPREAAQIRNNPELRAAFEEAYGISLDGLGEKAAANAITDAVKNQGIHERSVNQFGEVPEAAPSFAPAETGPNKSERAFARGGKARDAITSILAGDDISRKDATRIMSDPVMWEAFQEATGIDLSKKGKTEQNVREAFREAKANQNQEAQTDLQTQLAEAEAELDNYLDGLQGTPGELKTPEYNDLVNRVNDLRSQLGMEPETSAAETTTETNANEAESEAAPAQEETAAKEETPSQNQSESNAKPAQNKPKKPDHSRKVTNPNEDTDAAFDKLNKKNGSIEPGENPARDINVPKKDTKGLKVGEGARTIFEADATPDERIASLKAAVVNGNFGHIPVSNDTRSKNATKRLAKDGWSRSVSDFLAAVDSGRADADTIALGAHLLNEAGNSTECSGKQYVQLAMAYNDAVSDAGSRLAAGRILKTLTPEGKLYGMEKTVEKMNREIRKNNEKKKPGKQKAEIKLNEQLVEDYLNAKTNEERNKIQDKMVKDVAEQVPNTFRDKFTALRYLNMLGNFKTQVRNFAGNTGMTVVQKVKNEARGGIEGLVKAATGGKYEQQYKGGPGLAKRLKVASEDFVSDADLQAMAMGEKKFSDVAKQSESEIKDAKDPFSNKNPLGKFLNAYSKATNAAMELGDLIFVRANYADALAGYMNAHNISEADWKAMVNDPAKSAEVDKARAFAIKQAQEATFRDTNAVSKFASTFDQRWPGAAKKVAQGVIPFRKTPANVLVRMEEYSPLGVINTAVKGIQAAKGTAEASAVIDSAAKSLTGTGLTVLGILMASMGKARTKDDDKNEEAFAKLKGQQDYSVEVGGTSMTMDWLSPASAPFFMGVEAYNLAKDGDFKLADLFNAAMTITNPMLEMSMLSGVNDALNNLNDFDGDNSAIAQFVLNSAWSYLTQGISNTMLGQIEQFSEKNRQTYYTDSDNPLLPTWAQKKVSKLMNKTPLPKYGDYQAADYIDAWGRKQANDPNYAERAWNVFLNPGYVSKMDQKATEADAVIDNLLQFSKTQKERDDFPNVVPRTPSRNETVNGKKLTPEEYDVYATTKGQESLKAVTELSKSDIFKGMDEFAQGEAIAAAYEYAEFLAASKIAKSRGEEYKDTRFDGLEDVDHPALVVGVKAGFNDGKNHENWDGIDSLLKAANSGKMSKDDLEYLDGVQGFRKLMYYSDQGVGSKDVHDVETAAKEKAKAEYRTDANATDLISTLIEGKYSPKVTDAFMGMESNRNEENIQNQVRYEMDKLGKSESEIQTILKMMQEFDDDEVSKAAIVKEATKNVPKKEQSRIKDVITNWTKDRHDVGKSRNALYESMRKADDRYTLDDFDRYWSAMDKNGDGQITKKEYNGTKKKIPSEYRDDITKYLFEAMGW